MKKILMILAIALAVVSCAKDDENKPTNNFIGTSWTAQDDIASFIYGPGCTTTIEFLTESECQRIDYRTGKYGSTTVDNGTYTFKQDSVYWQIGDRTRAGKATGSVLVSTMNTMAGGKLTYTKNN